MIAQWENECTSLSVLYMAQVMIAQWENECTSLSVLSIARVMIAQWENECTSLSVLSITLVRIAQWENECTSLSVLSMARIQFPVVAEYCKGFFLDAGRKSYNDTPQETLSQILSRSISAQLLTVALSWRQDK